MSLNVPSIPYIEKILSGSPGYPMTLNFPYAYGDNEVFMIEQHISSFIEGIGPIKAIAISFPSALEYY